MQIVRTVVWVLLLVALALFSINNWQDVEVKIWEGLILQTKLPALVLLSFALGLVPMWLLHKGASWRWNPLPRPWPVAFRQRASRVDALAKSRRREGAIGVAVSSPP